MTTPPRKPLLGILTVQEGSSFRGNKTYYQHLSEAASKRGEKVVVLPVSFALTPPVHTLQGWQWDARTKQWLTIQCRCPSVLYNRIPTREAEASVGVALALSRIHSVWKIPLFNPHFFNKWQLYAWLRVAERLPGVHLPATTRLLSASDGIRFQQQYPNLMLKPVSGKAGIGMYRVDPHSIRFQDHAGVHPLSFSGDLSSRWHALWNRLHSHLYIAQQAIPLAVYHQQPFDIRVLVQKNRSAAWQVTGHGIRVAGKDALTTHVPRGGRIAPLEEVFAQVFHPSEVRPLVDRVHSASLLTAQQIEQAAGQLWGEMSMDWGIDLHGQLWFFEANAKPMIFDEPLIFKKSLQQIIAYARYLRVRSDRSSRRCHKKTIAKGGST